MEVWSLGTQYTLIRILSPAKDKGISTLRREKQMWNYLPKTGRQLKISPSMMMGSWMGSDFSNDDLVKQTNLAEEYTITMVPSEKSYELSLVPKAETATVWGKIVIVVQKKNLIPLEYNYFNEKGEHIRQLKFSEPKNFQGRIIPSVLEMRPMKKKNQFTMIRYKTMNFRPAINKSFFSLRKLKNISR